MRSFQPIVISTIFLALSACGGGSGPGENGNTNIQQLDSNLDLQDVNLQTTIANAYCTNQKKLQLISESLLRAYSPKGNGADKANCGGENAYTDDGTNFTLDMKDYCIEKEGKQYLLNGSISGMTESGNNFTSTISNLSITGNGVNLSIDGDSYDGRADDNFVNLNVHDGALNYSLDQSSVKKGEFDFGYLTFPTFASAPYQFITHFNADNTEGLLFIYGNADDKIIISGDQGMITAVYSANKQDPGTWLDLPCNN